MSDSDNALMLLSMMESTCIFHCVFSFSYSLIPENSWLIHNNMNIADVIYPIILKSCFIYTFIVSFQQVYNKWPVKVCCLDDGVKVIISS